MHIRKEEKDHQARIAAAFLREHKDKFYGGAIEHQDQGMLKDIEPAELVEFAIEEVLDLASYLYTLREVLLVDDDEE